MPEVSDRARLAWKVVENMLAIQGRRLPPGASDDEIVQGEAILGRKLPRRVAEVFQVHDGCPAPGRLFALSEAVSAWEQLCTGRDAVFPPHWLPLWEEPPDLYFADMKSRSGKVLSVVADLALPVANDLPSALTGVLRPWDSDFGVTKKRGIASKAAAKLVWAAIEADLRLSYPGVFEGLPRGASEKRLAAAEKTFGYKLPAAVREVYRVRDGIGIPAVKNRTCQASPFLCLRDAVKEWEGLTNALEMFRDHTAIASNPGVRACWWDRKWVPIATFGNGDLKCIDLHPAPGGKKGQIISFAHDDPVRTVVARDLLDYLLCGMDMDDLYVDGG